MRIRYQIALAGLSLGFFSILGRQIVIAILSMGRRPICPRCGSATLRLSSNHGIVDRLYRVVGCPPYRCLACNNRFYRPRVKERPGEDHPVLVKPERVEASRRAGGPCPGCGGSDIRHSYPKPLLDAALRRAFRIYPYRCRACGRRFYLGSYTDSTHKAA